ncbi:maleylpyruvate isomerase family mycothiol-dependent enzyme [Actinomadura sp. 9N407]|uniref:maleylpyruvate isomerase family mycothiol-dependent enzyme n=1 Tax=Actinomadura sp. 9N407 TaxID=3375154 RepID=UPI0037AB48F1
MGGSPDPAVARAWMDEGTRLLLEALDRLADADLDAATGLPGWTRRHVVAHVHFNAEALRRLASWARTGTENRMYAGPEQRNAEIESGSALPAADLRALVRGSAAALAADLDALPPDAWANEVVTAQGRTVPATEIVWMRTRETAVHAVDLDAGVEFEDLPSGLVAALIDDIVAKRVAGGQGPALARLLSGRGGTDIGPWL